MADQNYVAIAAQYADTDGAVADFDRIRAHFAETPKKESFDAAVISRELDGKISIVKRDDGGKHHGTKKGLTIGLATGLAVALFPAVALGGALVVAGGSGAGIGAIAGHIGRKTPTRDLESISETLDAGSGGIVLVLEPEDVDGVEGLLAGATKVTKKDLSVDDKELDEEVDEAYE
ncbi:MULTISPECIES: hypothetical protein [unclassified Leifsonia]|uniref:hypothetical protein n=1 Tax=unclassified Leifsonia TaxID=2663824 RepID=UPI0006F1FD7D|nr:MULTISPECIES: hypothetical protein [unclassified Leifsonia]KQX08001.1 hypothetical protein ASC59_09930 [Leifsonia sp. Root1293]KRA12820.1 hypothetical protein ASD61_09930 [Leifsonia sp. Root60]